MSAPTLKSTQHGTYPKGKRLGLSCYERGQSVKGYYSRYIPGGWDNLWYQVSDGFWVADVDINTGSNNPVTGRCTHPAKDGRKWGAGEPSNSAYWGQCTWGAKERFKAYSGVYPKLTGNALSYYASARASGWSTSLDAQPNSIVVFQPGVQGAWFPSGHVAWVTKVTKRSGGVYVDVIDMNYAGQVGKYTHRTVKDVPGMSYVLAPRRR